ncbi:UbiA prenyltransferase family-domain-containing protein [Nemania abortiva]|nr:UbiA prenyltransferase family-domain-containing protein [Nemania abortiva]
MAGIFPLKRQILWPVVHNFKTLILFTISDVKTVMIPQSAFAFAAVTALAKPTGQEDCHPISVIGVCHMLLWMWLHLLVENLANQRLPASIKEDVSNKPWRPLASGRINLPQAKDLLKIAVTMAATHSVLVGVTLPSIALMALVWLYNDLGGANAGPLQRNLVNAGGLACFGWGAVIILARYQRDVLDGGQDLPPEGKQLLLRWVALTFVVVATTVFSQDFPDTLGDKARGRKTMPLVYSEQVCRVMLAFLVLFWSMVCPMFWTVGQVGRFIPLCVGITIAVSTLCSRRQSSDETVWRLWCLWITILYLLPICSI